MTKENVSPIPNAITAVRLVVGLVMFVLLAGAAGGVPFLSAYLTIDDQFAMQRWACVAFVVASVTDFADGYLARKMHAETRWGAILDPIADKILVCGTILGLFALGAQPVIALPTALILFREFAVSALREAAAGRGVAVPVTLLAKWKTTIQLVALGLLLLTESWAAFDFDPIHVPMMSLISYGLIWIAAAITVWTGAVYFIAAKHDI
ncbi:CDP-diacylglycerol--glycerol-3-phosphate 3-phosphatidyltransferase [Asticcacaulis sp. ZE23SCel15]|uniref:CDP-diacylglycerol--glycerol-3-phosphate 3-phosphatidyltransferase n=1 Tax=Asticcacaulis sp. ZE23SCel15 TaxID=3059027 RepID=UPI00265F9BDC|nr:CDP-diacylglycerol--glycerol-3-phosphate 3-phosphatidyltransferase [Asticcacaulis sp. ZE23SCel15]WKL55801.1 CDP-diacylglycerol--glycerol-3-phosphate 3-phosphatidyltransferase [Asticcacaulis sp. ZE23SCel15]